MSIRLLSVTDAHGELSQGAIYIDVRSTGEFALGHPAGAVNVPLQEPDEDTGVMTSNPDFIRVMTANFGPGTSLLIGCQSGNRSARAAQMLVTFGFTQVAHVKGGYGGGQDPGWAASGLPTETCATPGAGYRALLAIANAAT